MVAVEQDALTGERRIFLRPNHEVNWRQTLLVYGLIAATSLAVAGGMAALGFWPVLLVSCVVLCLLAWALAASGQRAQARESIVLKDDRIAVWKGRRRHEACWIFESYWTEVAFEPPVYRWYPNRLMLRSRGEWIELGEFLRDDERADLADCLRRWIGPMAASGECA